MVTTQLPRQPVHQAGALSCSKREIRPFFEGKQKGSKSPKPEKPCLPNLVSMHFTSTSTCIKFLSQFYFLTPMDYIVHGPKGNFSHFEGKQKWAKSPKPDKPHQPNLVSMHFTSTSTCIKFLSQFYFLTPMDYIVHDPKENFGHFEGKQKWAKSPKPDKPHQPNLVYMHFTSTSTCINFLSRFYFLTPMDYSPWSEGKFWPF